MPEGRRIRLKKGLHHTQRKSCLRKLHNQMGQLEVVTFSAVPCARWCRGTGVMERQANED
eukprot:8506773-Ditylum_brightwellii.AAC.1